VREQDSSCHLLLRLSIRITPRLILTPGKLAEEILKAAVQTNADWIVLGAEGGLRSWLFPESAACKMVAAAPCPVLTLRHEPAQIEVANLEEVHFTSPL
jgi:nucleotide-binding universal stress UspA family protein